MGKSQKIQYVNIIIITLKRGMTFYLNFTQKWVLLYHYKSSVI